MGEQNPASALGTSEAAFSAVNSGGLPELLRNLGISLLVSTYQAGKLVVVREAEGTVWTLLRTFDRPMGLAAAWRDIAIGTRRQVWFFRDAPEIAPRIPPLGRHDACFVPRFSCVTGDILGHEMVWIGSELWVVNTLFSCLASVHTEYSFVPRWRPPFVSALAPEDRCHLNGVAVAEDRVHFVTALGATDTPEGWRPGKANGGILLEVPTGQVVCRGLSMPHSPRVHQGRLWLLEGGTGQLLTVDPATGRRDTVAVLPGFVRGLAFHGHFAFVGLSRARESAWFGGLPITSRPGEPQCGVWVIDLRSGQSVQFMKFQSGVEEIFAVELLRHARFPEIIGFQEDTLDRTYVLPPASPDAASARPAT